MLVGINRPAIAVQGLHIVFKRSLRGSNLLFSSLSQRLSVNKISVPNGVLAFLCRSHSEHCCSCQSSDGDYSQSSGDSNGWKSGTGTPNTDEERSGRSSHGCAGCASKCSAIKPPCHLLATP